MLNKLRNFIEQKRDSQNYFWKFFILIKDSLWRFIQPFKRLDVSFYSESFFSYLRKENSFANIDTYCVFVGHGRSGSTLVHALLDAHPQIVISNELSFSGFFNLMMFNKNLIFSMILERNKAFVRRGQVGRGGYIYHVPNQWQGKTKEIKIIGDKDQIKAANKIYTDQSLVDRIKRRLNIKVKLIHVIRNPFDAMSSLFLARGGNLIDIIKHYFLLMDKIRFIKEKYHPDFIEVYHEELIKNPSSVLKKLNSFLGVRAAPKYLDDCRSIIWSKPNRSRYKIQWPPELIEMVQKKINDYAFLKHYSYEN